MSDAYRLTTILDAALARRRSSTIGLVSVDMLPPRPVYSNDVQTEQFRESEYAQLVERCSAEAAAWNLEAQRWHAQRVSVVTELVCASARQVLESEALASDKQEASSSIAEDTALTSSKDFNDVVDEDNMQRGASRLRALQISELLFDESGLAASAVLTELADRQVELDATLDQVQQRARWLCGVSDQRLAVAALCEEQRAAFVARWRQRAIVSPPEEPPDELLVCEEAASDDDRSLSRLSSLIFS